MCGGPRSGRDRGRLTIGDQPMVAILGAIIIPAETLELIPRAEFHAPPKTSRCGPSDRLEPSYAGIQWPVLVPPVSLRPQNWLGWRGVKRGACRLAS
jgi:hypothetical protein